MQDLKINALLATVKAYMSRGNYIQYDQRCMDRMTFFSPRRTKYLPPEAATEQYTFYLDCSSYVGALFYETFGYELESDLTWHMIDLVKPRIYYYEFTHNESVEDRRKIEEDIRKLLLPGDVITYDRGVGSGHTMLYIGDGKYTHCTPNGRPDSYDYINKKSREYPDGALFIEELSVLFETRLFEKNVRRFSVSRPLSLVGQPTERTMRRIGSTNELICSVITSHPGGRNVLPGEFAEYNVLVKNSSNETRYIEVCFYHQGSLTKKELSIEAAHTESAIFSVNADENNDLWVEGVQVKINSMEIYVPRILKGKDFKEDVLEKISSMIIENMHKKKDTYELISEAYKEVGINLEKSARHCLNKLFYLHDCPVGDVLSRRIQKPFEDMTVYSYFGGTGVVTPEIAYNNDVRTNQIKITDFLEGDVILVSDDAYFNSVQSYYYTGETFIGWDKSLNEFTDSLLGNFCFVLLRPVNKGIVSYDSYKQK